MNAASPTAGGQSLEHVPITLFSVAMGLAGLSLAWRRAIALGAPAPVGQVLFWFARSVFLAVLGVYLVKAARYPLVVRGESVHPIRVAFLATPGTALLLLAAAGQQSAPVPAEVMWWFGASVQLALTVNVVSRWVGDGDLDWAQVTP